jgi:hypothetical protein
MSTFFPTIADTKNLNLKKWINNESISEEMRFEILLMSQGDVIKQDIDFPTVEKPVIDCIFYENKSLKVQVIVQCMFIESEVSLQHYMEYFSMQANEKILEQRCINNDCDKPDMLASRSFDDGETWITRRTAYKRWAGEGAYVIIANVATDQKLYNQNAALLFAISNSLKPIGIPEYDKAERLKLVTKRYPLDFATYLPWSWEDVHHHNDTLQKMNLVYTKTIRGEIKGVFSITCRLWSEDFNEMNDVLKEVHKPYKVQGINLNGFTLSKTDSVKGFPNFMKGSIDFPQDTAGGSKKNNISFYIGKKNNAWFYSEIFGPAKETDFEAWAINDRAMEIANENMHTL